MLSTKYAWCVQRVRPCRTDQIRLKRDDNIFIEACKFYTKLQRTNNQPQLISFKMFWPNEYKQVFVTQLCRLMTFLTAYLGNLKKSVNVASKTTCEIEILPARDVTTIPARRRRVGERLFKDYRTAKSIFDEITYHRYLIRKKEII